MKVWLDDLRPMPEEYQVHVKTAQEAIDLLKQGIVEAISLDHDLGDAEAGTGYDVACFIEKSVIEGSIPMPAWYLHTANPVGKKRMHAALTNADNHKKQV